MFQNCDEYPPSNLDELSREDSLLTTLKLFMETVVTSRNPSVENIRRKRIANGQTLISACRPQSYLSPLLLARGVNVYRNHGSKTLIQLFNSFGLCVPMVEVRRYEYSALQTSDPVLTSENYVQFVFDNADYDVRSLDGRNTMGGIKCITPGPKQHSNPVPRIREIPPALDIAATGKFEIQGYKKPPVSGMRNVQIKKGEVDNLQSAVAACHGYVVAKREVRRG